MPVQAMAPGASLPPDIRIDWTNMVVSRDELVCLALNDYWEARGEDTRGRVAVAQVVLNRTRDPRFPNSICDVVTENRSSSPRLCQFSWYCDGRPDTPADPAAWRASVLLAKSLLMRNNAISDLTGGALWYHNRAVDPGWSGRLEFATRVGDHYFYREAGPRVQQAGTPPMTFADWTDEQARTKTGEDSDQLARSNDR
ncbi:cell wall hydrolase [Roseospira marina]|uniref:Cell wall hydrolase n=2 Tax=Roseospira marina TaxID=140057 RepID=A0A5M6IGX2_9PROT|nr:cell wall hydrolase [Roseospira marina]